MDIADPLIAALATPVREVTETHGLRVLGQARRKLGDLDAVHHAASRSTTRTIA